MKKLSLLIAFIAATFVSFAAKPPRVDKGASKVKKAAVFPVAGHRSVVRDKWGASRAGGIRKHKGIDIHARKGTPVVAVCDGIIVTRDHTPIGGKTLWLRPAGQAWTAYYAHLDQQLVTEGQRVRKGQVIGTVGNTGNARTTPSHLHFGVTQGNQWVNPLPYVSGAKKVVSAPKSPQKTVRKVAAKSSRTVSKKTSRTVTKATPVKKKAAPVVRKKPVKKTRK
ncbi:M23 family metallopeptidase [Paraflavisolibacter sp. H34]|uniref:M23 family metallopeptidase n=1 Tax=Huijunlia imazamoxiresistens TaxID=3127457 RepID=UPI003016CA0C